MSRTLLGIDLDESPVGGLIEGLLEAEDLEKLADGGTEDDRDAEDGPGATERPDSAHAESDSSAADSETPSPGAEPIGLTGGPDADRDDENGDEGRLSRFRSVLVKLVAVVAVLGIVALVAWRYGGRIKAAVASRLDRGEDDEGSGTGLEPSGGDDDRDDDDRDDDAASPARYRAKATEPADEREGESPAERPESRPAPEASNTDLGALVGLAALALIAAIVRKFGEGRPYDPLVDGPRPGSDGADGERDAGDRP